jgi:hypothetical protein
MVLARIQSQYQKVRAFYKKYESFFMPALIIWGFIYHYFTFKVIPFTDVLYLVFGYLGLATLTIVFMHVYDMGRITHKLRYVRLFVPLLLQFAIGSMIGGVFIFYWFSGSIFVSWPFILFIIMLILGLEFYKHYLENPIVQFGLYNFAAFLLLAVALPYFFTSINPGLFMAAGWISLALVLVLSYFLRNAPAIAIRKNRILIVSILIFVVMNVFYFANLIPPVPLSIRDEGVYHDVVRSGSEYVLQTEPQTFWQKFTFVPTIHLAPGERAYVFSLVYSPTDLDTDIVHDWQHYDTSQNKWVSVSQVSFHVTGGREDGFRGYSYKTNVEAGKWRVYTKTPRGQILGRYQFKVESVAESPALVQEIK